MANPAQLLLNQFNIWRKPSGTAGDVRAPMNDDWLAHRLAVRHIDAIDQLLGEMQQANRTVNVYRQYLNQWTAIVFSYPAGWSAAKSGDIDRRVVEHLETLADSLTSFVPTLQGGGIETINVYTETVIDALAADESLPEALRIHAMEVVAHLKWCADRYDVVGDFDLQEALERLAATILRVVANSSEENRSNLWGPVMTNWIWPFTTNMVAAIPSSALALLALGSS